MPDILQKKLDQIRKQGYRPVVVGCFVSKQKVLMVYKEKYDLWQFPQGGIENKETISQALIREMKEELGLDLGTQTEDIIYLGEDQLKFSARHQGSRELRTDAGTEIKMKGKKYFFIAIKAKLDNFNVKDSEFDDSSWLNFAEAQKVASKIYQPGKKRITLRALELLKQQKLI